MDMGAPAERSIAWWRRARWRYAAAAFVLGVLYSGLAMVLDLEMRIAGQDVSMLVAGVLELSFGAFGYLLGLTTEARQGERLAAKQAASRADQVAELRQRLAQTEKLASIGTLASTVAHEVRNPLAIIRSMTQNLSEELPPEATSARAACHDIVEEVDRLAGVTSRLVDFARPLQPRLTDTRLAEVIERVKVLASPLLAGTELLVEGPPMEVSADPDLLTQMLLGLVENAIAASPAGGRVTMRWRSAEARQTVEILVDDQGPGIDPELRERVFEPFFTTRSDGHGLGLAVARQIAVAHGGSLDVAADGPTGGARFVASLRAA